ncbi:hypothetical protein HCN44_008565 [Aphidius gifuensis]|uniref:Uncharacterized protein n=1 Tax=Aphidius gifuensis TaxID=684658 RepID=A0A834XNE4_APHGI|nr:hypothetical protein HCN44_008565 [Aphidius gifuensis]
MSGFVKIGLRLFGTARYIPNKNTTKYLQSMCLVRNGSSHVTKNSITSAQKKSAGYWKIISTVTKNILWYSTIPLTVIVVGSTYIVVKTPTFWEDIDAKIAAEEETLKYSIIPSKIITSSVLFDDGVIQIKTQEDNIHLMNDNTRNLMGSKELNANILEPFPRGKPIPIKIGKFTGLLDKGKLTLKTEEGDTTFTFHHTVGLEVKKLTETLQNEIAANEKEQTIIRHRRGKFIYSFSGYKITLETPEHIRELTGFSRILSDSNFNRMYPIIGNFSSSYDTTVKIQKDNSDEVYYCTQIVNVECDKKLDENLQNQLITIKKVSSRKDLAEEMKTCELVIDSGVIVFKTQDGDKFVVQHRLTCEVFEDGEQTYLNWTQDINAFDSL